jgi:3-deoxy-D-manno-octulosonic-acid transferase
MSSGKKILVHAVSVGEFLGAMSFINALKDAFPDYEILVSTTTLTSNRIAKKKIGNDFKVLYFPLDFPWAVHRFFERVSPSCVVLVETELWPNFLWTALRKKIPVMVVNGRISEHSYRNYSKAKFFFKNMCRSINGWGVQFDRDKNRLVDLGVCRENIFVNGSMKFDSAVESSKNVKSIFKVKPGCMVLAGGSTHSGEEQILIDIYREIKSVFANLILVIAPRHIERVNEVQSIAERYGLKCVRRSDCTQGMDVSDYDVVLVDTMGELISVYDMANIVFVGKSLCKGGGQNLLEPAGLGKAVVCGPLMGNFLDITLWLVENKGIIQVKDKDELKKVIVDLLNNTNECGRLGNRARDLVFQEAGSVSRNVDLVKKILIKKEGV